MPGCVVRLAAARSFPSTGVVLVLSAKGFTRVWLETGETFKRVPNEILKEIPLHVPPHEGAILARGGSSDRFLLRAWREANPWLVDELDLGFSDMESYGVALAAKMHSIPCTVCRVISDDAQGRRPKDYKKFCLQANQKFVEVLYSLLELPSEKSPTSL